MNIRPRAWRGVQNIAAKTGNVHNLFDAIDFQLQRSAEREEHMGSKRQSPETATTTRRLCYGARSMLLAPVPALHLHAGTSDDHKQQTPGDKETLANGTERTTTDLFQWRKPRFELRIEDFLKPNTSQEASAGRAATALILFNANRRRPEHRRSAENLRARLADFGIPDGAGLILRRAKISHANLQRGDDSTSKNTNNQRQTSRTNADTLHRTKRDRPTTRAPPILKSFKSLKSRFRHHQRIPLAPLRSAKRVDSSLHSE